MKNISRVSLYFFATFVAIASSSVWMTVSLRVYVYLAVIFLGLTTLGLALISSRNVRIRKNSLSVFVFLVLLLIVYFVRMYNYWVGNVSRMQQFVFLFLFFLPVVWLLFTIVGHSQFFHAYVNVITILAFVSLFFWVSVSLFHILRSSGSMPVVWGVPRSYPTFHYLYFESQTTTLFGRLLVRNSGIWPEGPMYAMVLSFAWIFELYISQIQRKPVLVILGLTLLSTLTFSAILVLGLSLLIGLIKAVKSRHSMVTSWSLIILSLVALVPVVKIAVRMVTNKAQTVSASVRLDDYVAGFHSWMHGKLFGHGLSNFTYLSQYMNLDIRRWYMTGIVSYNTGLANGWTQIVSDGGLVLLLVYLVMFVRGLLKSRKNRKLQIAYLFVLVFMFMFTMSYTYILIAFLASSITEERDSLAGDFSEAVLSPD